MAVWMATQSQLMMFPLRIDVSLHRIGNRLQAAILRRDNIASRRKALAMAKPTKNHCSGLCIHTKNGKNKNFSENPVQFWLVIPFIYREGLFKRKQNPRS